MLTSINSCIRMAVKSGEHSIKAHDVQLPLFIRGQRFTPNTVTISYRYLYFFCNEGHVGIHVNQVGDQNILEIDHIKEII